LKYRIEKIALKNMKQFTQSKLFINSDTIAISKNRVASYINNPRGNSDDIVLYIAIHDNKIVAFRTVLADMLFYKGEAAKIAWFSGSWVDEKFRRKGISITLMTEVFNDWGERMLYTNYAPASKLLYDKSDRFSLLIEKVGVRLYFNINFTKLLSHKNIWISKQKLLLTFIDYLSGVYSSLFRIAINKRVSKHINNVTVSDKTSDIHYAFIRSYGKSLFKRNKSEYEWVFNYPWITSVNRESKPYPFSSFAQTFFYKTLTVYDKENIAGLAIIKVRDENVDIPVFIALNIDTSDKLTNAILSFCHSNNISMLTCYNEDFINSISKVKNISLFRKKMNQNYYISKELKNRLALNNDIHTMDGDGDCIFT